MVIDITDVKDFDTRFLHHLIENRENITLVGHNSRLEQCIKILGLEELIKHEKSTLTTV